MGGGGGFGSIIQRVVAPWSYRDGNVLNAIVDPLNLQGWDQPGTSNFGASKADEPDQPETPQVPQDATAAAAAKLTAKKKARAMARSDTVYTTPLGVADTASINRKTLLGQ